MTFFSFLFKKRFPGAQARRDLFTGPLTLPKLVALSLAAALIVVLYVFIIRANNAVLVTVPARGGTLVEGIVGAPRAINPLTAVTDTDLALTSLSFSGLMKQQADGTPVPELAQEYTVSPDGRTYTFTLRENLSFSDGTPLFSSDVASTVMVLQNPAVNPRTSAYWQQVSVATPDPRTVVVTLPAPDDTFLARMAVGILSDTELRQEEGIGSGLSPLGAGPFVLAGISYDEAGAPRRFHFERNRRYAPGAPLLSSLDVAVYANQDELRAALARGDIDFTFALAPETLTAEKLPGSATFTAIPTNRQVALWQLPASELAAGSLRATLNRFIDKTAVVGTIENGYGILPAELPAPLPLDEAQAALQESGYTVADGVLSRNGTPVTLSVATLNDPKLLATAQSITQSFTALGAVTQVLGFDRGTLIDELAQRNLPLVLTDGSVELPAAYSVAIPLYTAAAVLAADSRTHGVAMSSLASPALRYAGVAHWHTRTDRVWPFLARSR